METISGILELPLEILHIVLDLLDLASIYQLGAVCRSLHRLIHQVSKLQMTILFSFAVIPSPPLHTTEHGTLHIHEYCIEYFGIG